MKTDEVPKTEKEMKANADPVQRLVLCFYYDFI
jgi:hypothetical protein